MKEESIFSSDDSEKLQDKVVVEPEIKTGSVNIPGGLLLSAQGKVISIEANVTTCKPGDIVTFDQTAGQEILLFGRILKILKESEVTPVTGTSP